MIAQIDLIVGIMAVLDKLQPGISLLPRQANAVIAAADSILTELATPERTVRPGMGLAAWLQSDCTGASSLFMAHTLAGYGAADAGRYNYPHDAADFGRCLGLLDAVPCLSQTFTQLSTTGEEWAALVPAWEELTALYRAGHFELVSDRIAALTRVKDGA